MQVAQQNSKSISVVIPACNEVKGLQRFLPKLMERYAHFEVIVVDDGSSDETATFAASCGAKVISHPYQRGNGASIKTGARAATGDILVFMDGDGQHDPDDIPKLLAPLDHGFDMAVGARNRQGQASWLRHFGNGLYNRLASKVVGRQVKDLTSGFRAVYAQKFRQFLPLLPNGFSYPSTITMAFFRSGYCVEYVPIDVHKREGKSHLRPFKDGIRFFVIIYKITTLYSPLKIFLPLGALHVVLGLANYAYTFATMGRFTNMSAVMLSTAIIIFLIGLVSEQITTLIYQHKEHS